MRPGAVLSEAWRNIVSGTTRVPLYALLIALTAGLCATAEVAAVHTVHNNARAFIDGGGSTRVLLAEDKIDARQCQALTRYDSIDASGALRQAPDTIVDELAVTGFQTYEVTPGFGSLLAVPANAGREGGVWISEDFAQSLGVNVGSELTTSGATLRIAGVFVYPDDGRDARLSYAFVIPATTDDESFDECWMRSWPETPEAEGILRTALGYQDSTNTDVSLSQLNKSLGASFDGAALFNARLTRWAPLVALSAGLLIGFASTRLRRLEHASNLHAGQSRAAMCTTRLIEVTTWSVLGAVLAGSAVYLGAGILAPLDLEWVMSLALPPLIAAISGTIVGAAASALLVREADLFRYFKER